MASILVICTGNICRSPIAEGLLRDALERRFSDRAPAVSSVGTRGLEGSGAMPESVQAADEMGIDIGGHVARRLTADIADEADLLLCMATEHRDTLATGSERDDRTFTLKELVRLLETLPAPTTRGGTDGMGGRIAAASTARRQGAVPFSHDDDIADPLGQPLEAYRAIAWELDVWIERLVSGLFGAAADLDAAEGS